MKIKFETSNFTISIPTIGEIKTSIFELIYHAATYGYKNRFPHFFEMIHRGIIIIKALKRSDKQFAITPYYNNADSTEKTFTSYVIGMTACSLFASKILNYKYLLHYDYVEKHKTFHIDRRLGSNEKPDFISERKNGLVNEYLVIEGKGTANEFDRSKIGKGKSQVRSIDYINKLMPLKVVTLSFFRGTPIKYLRIYAEDPESINKNNITFDIDFKKEYLTLIKNIFKSIEDDFVYKKIDNTIFINYINKANKHNNANLNIKDFDNIIILGQPISGTNFYIGIIKDIFESPYEELNDYDSLIKKLQMIFNISNYKETDSKNEIDFFDSEDIYIGDEGIIIAKNDILINA